MVRILSFATSSNDLKSSLSIRHVDTHDTHVVSQLRTYRPPTTQDLSSFLLKPQGVSANVWEDRLVRCNIASLVSPDVLDVLDAHRDAIPSRTYVTFLQQPTSTHRNEQISVI